MQGARSHLATRDGLIVKGWRWVMRGENWHFPGSWATKLLSPIDLDIPLFSQLPLVRFWSTTSLVCAETVVAQGYTLHNWFWSKGHPPQDTESGEGDRKILERSTTRANIPKVEERERSDITIRVRIVTSNLGRVEQRNPQESMLSYMENPHGALLTQGEYGAMHKVASQ